MADAIGFPPPLLGKRALRLAILERGGDWLALEKPAGVAVRQHPWDPDRPDLDAALNRQLEAGKPELQRLGAELFGSVFYLDPAISGLALFGTSREGVARLRNGFGSEEMEFEFELVARDRSADEGERRTIEAPLLPHRSKAKMIPSTAKGKKARTRFEKRAEGAAGWSLWTAFASFIRPHQIRAHARLAGLSVMADSDYEGSPAPLLRELKPRARGAGLAKPLFLGPAVHLRRLKPGTGEADCVAPRPQAFDVLLKHLGLPQ